MFTRRILRLTRDRSFTTSLRVRAVQSPEGQAISEVSKAEGGPHKGSTAAQMQSEITKQRNAEQGGNSLEGQAISEVSKAEGGTTKGSTAARMQSELTKQRNMGQGIRGVSTSGKSPGQAISEVAKAEGGPRKGSTAARMQSELTKKRNLEQGIGGASTSGKSPKGQAISEVSKAEGGTTKGSTAARMQSELTKERIAEQGVGINGTSNGQVARERNFAEVASNVEAKIATNPESVTPEDANLARSRETRAFGATQKGGVASTAQKIASQNEKEGTV